MFSRAVMCLAAAGCLLAGCASEPARHPRDTAANDPMNYNPAGPDERYDVSGGGVMDFDRKSFRKDLDNVLSP